VARRKASTKKEAEPATYSRGKKAAFTAIALAFPFIVLAILEIGLRIAGYGAQPPLFDSPEFVQGTLLVPNQEIGARYFPREKYPPSPPGDFFLAIKPPNALRLFVMGESAAAGFPYPRNGTFSRVLQDALQDVLPNDTVEVINLGIAATNSYTIADLAREVVQQHPDAILIYAGHNEYYGALGVGSTETLGQFPAFVRLYLRLQRFRTVRLVRSGLSGILSALHRGSPITAAEDDPSRMASVVANQNIALGGAAYEAGTRQYESNLRYAIAIFRRARVPVFIASTPSNLRDLRPFDAIQNGNRRPSAVVFDSARAMLTADPTAAHRLFARARDLDAIRFRAPGEFRAIVKRVASETGSTYVPAEELVAGASKFGIPGSDLFLEHVHPNRTGYALLGRIFYDAIARAGFLGHRADTSRLGAWPEYERRMSLTQLDERIAFHTVRTIMLRWPFVPVRAQADYRGTYQPRDFIDSLALSVSRGGMPWVAAKVAAGERYERARDPQRALAEYRGLLHNQSRSEQPWRLIGRTFLEAEQLDSAELYLARAQSIRPSGFSAYALGLIALKRKDPARAMTMLEESLRLQPDTPPTLYQLSLAYALARNMDAARGAALRLAQVAPTYPGLGEWLTTLGIAPPPAQR
jgi:lysophospholipase L1-like esterase